MVASYLEFMTTLTHCPYCSMQCAMRIDHCGQSLKITPALSQEGGGGLCRKGWTAAETLSREGRVTSPLIRYERRGDLVPCDWDEAIAVAAGRIRDSQRNYGNDSVGVFGGGGLTNEKAYSLGKLARVALRTRNIDYNGRFCMSSAAAALNRSLGMDRGLPFPLADIADSQVLMLVGSNIAETMPPAMRYVHELKSKGGKLIVVDPRRTATATVADIHLQPIPGSDLALANGLMHICIVENYIDWRYIAERVSNFDEVRRIALSYWPEKTEILTGVPVAQMRTAASLLGESGPAMILTARGVEQSSSGTDTTSAFLNLAVALGKVGRPNSGFGTFTGQGNGQGGREHGQKADQLPGYRSIEDPAHRHFMAQVWGVNVDSIPRSGVSAQEMLSRLGEEDAVRTLLVMGSNPVVSAPDSNRLEGALSRLDSLIVIDPFMSETAELADVVLPCAQWAEETGTMTNVEGRVLLRQASLEPPTGVKTDLEIIHMLASALGFGHKFSPESEVVFNELRLATRGARADYSGITYQGIRDRHGIAWPCNSDNPSGTRRLFSQRFATEDGRARLFGVDYKGPAETPDAKRPVFLITGRTLLQYQSGTQTRRVESLDCGGAFVELHPFLAAKLSISDGQPVRIASDRGEAVLAARITPDIRTDTVFIPFHWPGQGRANLLTNPVLDPVSKMPEFKVCAVTLTAASRGAP